MQKEKLLGQIERQIKKCRQCRLWKARANAVPGEGSIDAEVVFIGEGPGFHENRQGRPFVGRAGELLGQLLRSIGAKRSDVWIGNVIKCRPPGNRSPLVDEVRACKPYLVEQIKAINPRIIVPLGRFAFEHFVSTGKISRDHGKAFGMGGRIIFPLYHPAAALRSQAVLLQLKAEFRKIPRLLRTDFEEVVTVERAQKDKNQMSLF